MTAGFYGVSIILIVNIWNKMKQCAPYIATDDTIITLEFLMYASPFDTSGK